MRLRYYLRFKISESIYKHNIDLIHYHRAAYQIASYITMLNNNCSVNVKSNKRQHSGHASHLALHFKYFLDLMDHEFEFTKLHIEVETLRRLYEVMAEIFNSIN